MPWFSLTHSVSKEQLFGCSASIMRSVRYKQVRLESDIPAFFGRNHDVPVHTIVRNEPLERLHTELLLYLNSIHCDPDDLAYVGAGYRPHVTDAGAVFAPGTVCHPTSFAILERSPDGVKRVVFRESLGAIVF
ncbi:hypothetical protein KKH15_02170 [Patescibacteria group bacterium]|nr:hypothetical protein [Patescibacteria group bacterium]MBU1754856.1 hypothetical protein [Patescibacteria group bacterium]